MKYVADEKRYNDMVYKKCGKSGLYLPAVSLGLWQNFGEETPLDLQKKKIFKAFDLGITHFDLANNYGRPADGSAEENFGRILKFDLMKYRDEMIISTKAGYDMWAGPYGNGGSRKYLMASLDQSLKRMGLDYVDIFYHHRPDPDTPLEETMQTLADIVKQGKALYVGISNYKKEEAEKAVKMLKEMKVPCLINQIRYNMFERWCEEGLLDVLDREGTTIADRYLSERQIEIVRELNKMAEERGQSLAQMALAWILRRKEITSVLIGTSKVEQIVDNVNTLKKLDFTQDELERIEKILK